MINDMQMGEIDFSREKFDLGELQTRNGEKWVITIFN